MTPYLAVFSARIRMLLQYRAAAMAGMATQIFWGWIRVMIFAAFHRRRTCFLNGVHRRPAVERRDHRPAQYHLALDPARRGRGPFITGDRWSCSAA